LEVIGITDFEVVSTCHVDKIDAAWIIIHLGFAVIIIGYKIGTFKG
jgi:hypothetical protein